MAVQFSRPDPSSPTSIASASFSTVRRGFDPNEVRGFLRSVSGELARLQERQQQLERDIAALKQQQAVPGLQFDDDNVTTVLGEEMARVLATAREAATSIRSRAEDGAARILREATDEATATRGQAELDAAKRLQEAQMEAHAHLEQARAQGRDMANEAREYRERVLADVGKRRELARMQLQQMVNGRERLLQAFERARLVAVDVLAEIDELGGEPEELVNLNPTTGPVPVMVPRPSVPSSTVAGVAAAGSQFTAPTERMSIRGTDAFDEQSHVAMYNVSDEPDLSDEADGARDAELATGATELPTDDADANNAEATVVEGIESGGPGDELSAPAAEPAAAEPAVVDLEADADPKAEAASDAGVAGADTVSAEAADGDDANDNARLAPVVSLFAGELDAQRTERMDRIDRPERPAQNEHSDRTQATSRVALDELFAKLKAAKAEEITRDVEAPPARVASSKKKAAVVEAVVVDEPTVFEHRDETLTSIVGSIARKMKRVLADEQSEVLDVLRRKEVVKDLDVLVPTEHEHSRSYAQVIHDDLLSAAVGGASFVHGSADPQRRIVDAGIIDTLLAEVDEAVVQPLRERLSAALQSAGSNEKLAQQARGIYREWKTSILDGTAGDLAASAYARGLAAVLLPAASVAWVISPATPHCDECGANAAAGAVRFGDAFPTGDLSAPAHLGCRCLVVPADH